MALVLMSNPNKYLLQISGNNIFLVDYISGKKVERITVSKEFMIYPTTIQKNNTEVVINYGEIPMFQSLPDGYQYSGISGTYGLPSAYNLKLSQYPLLYMNSKNFPKEAFSKYCVKDIPFLEERFSSFWFSLACLKEVGLSQPLDVIHYCNNFDKDNESRMIRLEELITLYAHKFACENEYITLQEELERICSNIDNHNLKTGFCFAKTDNWDAMVSIGNRYFCVHSYIEDRNSTYSVLKESIYFNPDKKPFFAVPVIEDKTRKKIL